MRGKRVKVSLSQLTLALLSSYCLAGSLYYMAPEVANRKPYNAACDVYSFAILLWQILMLKQPYELYTPKSLREKVYNGLHKRPPLDETINAEMKLLLKRSWAQDIHERHDMKSVSTILRKECVRARDGDDRGLEHKRRRSTFVYRPNVQKKNAEILAKASLAKKAGIADTRISV